RELPKDPAVERSFLASLRDFPAAVSYAPHQAYLGALHPRDLPARPWTNGAGNGASRFGPDGEIMPEEEFLGLLAAGGEFGLVALDPHAAAQAAEALANHPLGATLDLARIGKAGGASATPGSLPLLAGGAPVGAVNRAHDTDEALTAGVLLENLAGKATATL